MVFATIKENKPYLLCTCGHTAGDHLYCGSHLCVLCLCKGFELEASMENVLIAVRGPEEQPAVVNSHKSMSD